jgi:hypothetical protein
MAHQSEQNLIPACLAALARRVGVGLIVTYEEIERETDNDTRLEIACDGDAKCVRITVPEMRS